MKLIDIYNKIGKQPLKDTRKTDAIVFVDGVKYTITKVKYNNCKFIGFETEITEKWFSEMIKPEKDRYVIVKDDDGKEYNNYTWNGHCWYEWCINKDGTADGYPNRDISIFVWRYQN